MDNEQKIWNFLHDKIGNDYGVAGLMGNLYVESKLNPRNLQGSYEKKLGMTDDEYTEAVDSGKYDKFVTDSAGYGLAQWTYWSRKQGLFDLAKKRGVSIGDLDMQLDYLWEELQTYKKVLSTLKAATSLREASDIVLVKYEVPANQSEANKINRAKYGQPYYDKYASGTKLSQGNSVADEEPTSGKQEATKVEDDSETLKAPAGGLPSLKILQRHETISPLKR